MANRWNKCVQRHCERRWTSNVCKRWRCATKNRRPLSVKLKATQRGQKANLLLKWGLLDEDDNVFLWPASAFPCWRRSFCGFCVHVWFDAVAVSAERRLLKNVNCFFVCFDCPSHVTQDVLPTCNQAEKWKNTSEATYSYFPKCVPEQGQCSSGTRKRLKVGLLSSCQSQLRSSDRHCFCSCRIWRQW